MSLLKFEWFSSDEQLAFQSDWTKLGTLCDVTVFFQQIYHFTIQLVYLNVKMIIAQHAYLRMLQKNLWESNKTR